MYSEEPSDSSKIMRAKVGVNAHRLAKSRAALKGIPLRYWLEEAIKEKAEREQSSAPAEELCLA